jgi:hypothetical protein
MFEAGTLKPLQDTDHKVNRQDILQAREKFGGYGPASLFNLRRNMNAKPSIKSIWKQTATFFMIAMMLFAVLPVTPAYAAARTASMIDFTLGKLATIPTTTSVETTSGSPSTYGSPVTFTATVDQLAATGTVEFHDGITLLGSNTLINGVATLDISTLDVAGSPHSITAEYLGDDTYLGSTSPEIQQEVNAKPITVTADSGQTKVFGAVDPALTYASSDPAALFTGALDRASGEDVGTYAIVQGTLAVVGSNYIISSFVPADFSITPKPVTVTADSGLSKVFDAADPTFTYISSDPAATFTGALSRATGEDVGTYAITQGSLLGTGNFAITSFVPANFSITPKLITVTADSGLSKVFGEVDPTFTYTSSDPAATFTGALSRVAGENVGTYAITQDTLTAVGGNYTIASFVSADFSITAKPITVTANSGQTKIYGTNDPTFTYTPSDPAATFAGVLSRAAGENVGQYAITQGTLTAGSNYDITFVPANFSITVKTLTVTADNKSKDFGEPDPLFTFVVSGFVGSDDFITIPTCSVLVAHEAVDTYKIDCSGGNAGTNYNIVYTQGTLTVNEILPVAATLTSPTGAIGESYNPTYTWNKVSNATWYYLYVTGPSGNLIAQWHQASAVCVGETCSVTPDTILDVGAHTWWILTYNSVGNGPYSAGMAFSTSMPSTPPGVVTTLTPSGSIGTNYNPTYTWDKVAGATLYYLWVNGPGGNVLNKWYTSAQANCTGTTCSVTPATTLAGGAHIWWVQPWNPAGYGNWSSDKTFSTLPLGAAAPVSPTGNIDTNYTPNFVWNEVTGSTDYYLYISGPSGKVLDQWFDASAICSSGTCTAVAPATLGGGNFTWWVRTWNSAGYGPWSNGMAFNTTIPTPPGAATLTSPTGNLGTNYTPNFAWNEVASATYYELYIQGPSGKVLDKWYQASAICSSGTCTAVTPISLGGGNFTWWVRTWNSAGYGPWSSGMNFNTTIPTPPAAATLVSPTGSGGPNPPVYTWNKVTGATWYYVWVNGPSGNVHKQWYEASAVCGASTCSVTQPAALGSGSYVWWVQTWNSAGYGPWSSSMNFSIP